MKITLASCKRSRLYLMIGALALWPMLAGATTAIVTVKVVVMAPPPCVINGDRLIEVEFGDVMTTRVDGNNYRIPVDYTLSCTGASSRMMKMKMAGIGATFDGSVLMTTTAGLGLQLQQGDRKLPLNTWQNFVYPLTPRLWVVPVKQSGVALKGGEFYAGATMQIAYQ